MPANDPVFVDTSGWMALLNQDDHLHAVAAELMQQFASLRRPLVTTDWVLAETGNGLARTLARPRFPQFVRRFLQSPGSRLVRVGETVFQQALQLYEQMDDKTWGMIDCASFVVMRAEGIREAFTADRHFEQAGFRCLPASS